LTWVLHATGAPPLSLPAVSSVGHVPDHPSTQERPVAPERPGIERHHRDVRGGTARAAVFGVSDGLVSNVSLILGVAGADPAPGVVRLAGLAGLVAGAVSMAAGEYVSMKAQAELLEHELDMERIELRRNPHVETVELSQIYQSRGMQPDRARELAEEMMSDPDLALETHAREELGIDPGSLGSPIGAASSSFVAFAAGALVPLMPWFFASGTSATVVSVCLGALGAALIGYLLSRFTGRSAVRSVARQVAIATVAAGITFAIGSVVGVGV
jgi:VIT1/CCC1 family predicted Fe2+/Mn2+ transporter